MWDIIVVGGGPAGMTAALYSLRAGRSVLVLEKNGFGGQITYSPRVENYPGTLSMSGNEFAERLLDQIMAQGAEVELDTVTGIEDRGGVKLVHGEDGDYEGRAVIVAVGVKHRMLGLPGENELVGNGVSFCAVCDGDFYKGQDVAVVGGGNSALQEAVLLSETSRSVTILQDLPQLTGEKKLQDALAARDNVDIICGARVVGLAAENGELCGVEIETEGEKRVVDCQGLFVAIGLIPENDAFRDILPLDGRGYISANEECTVGVPGIYCAGDCRTKNVRQLTTAVADGASAAVAAGRYLDQ